MSQKVYFVVADRRDWVAAVVAVEVQASRNQMMIEWK
jgi:hypothetical protein